MKKLMILMVLFLATAFVGCDFLTTVTNDSDSTTNTSSSTETTIEEITTIDNDYITQSPNTNDVIYDDLFNDANYKRITIYFSESDLIDLINSMNEYHDQFGHYRDNTTIPTDVVYEDGKGNVMVMNEVGFRTKGNSYSRIPPGYVEAGEIIDYWQGSFQLEFNNTFEYIENSTQYDYLQSREFFDLEQLNFKRIRNDDYAVVTESVAYDMFREIGVNTSNTSYCVIYFNVDGEIVPYGLFLVQEVIDDVFVEMTYGDNPDGSIGDLFKCTWQMFGPATFSANIHEHALGISDWTKGYRKTYALKTNKDNPNYSGFWNFISLVNGINSNSYFENISTSLDMDSFAKALAMHFLVGSSDDLRSNANNYYMYFNDGNAYYIPFDFDNSLGYGWNAFDDYGIYLDIDTVTVANTYFSARSNVLVYYLLQEEEFLDMYLHYLDMYTKEGTVFTETYVLAEYDLIESLYRYEIYNTPDCLGLTWFNFEARPEDSMLISEYINQKTTEVRRQLSDLGYN